MKHPNGNKNLCRIKEAQKYGASEKKYVYIIKSASACTIF
jgi:hypothetical protein